MNNLNLIKVQQILNLVKNCKKKKKVKIKKYLHFTDRAKKVIKI